MTSSQLPPCEILPLPTVDTGVEWQQQHATWVYRGLLEGTILDHDDHTEAPVPHQVSLHELGRVPLPGGRVAVGDVFLADGTGRPQPLPVGEHSCVVGMGTIAEDHQRVVAALLLTGTQPIVRWSQGGVEDDPDEPVAVGGYYGFPIDSGVAAFFAPDGSETIEDLAEDTDDVVTLTYDTFEQNGFDGAMLRTLSGKPVAVFSTGWGDGHYPAWFGHAADGSVSVVMADFFVFEDPYPQEDEDGPATASPPSMPPAGTLTEPAALSNSLLTRNDLSPVLMTPVMPLSAPTSAALPAAPAVPASPL